MKLTLRFLLVIILGLNLFLRIYRQSSTPPSLFSDEVDAGYQAMVFNHCHTDFFGRPFPTHFKSFSDYRNGLYILSISLSQRIFGLSDFSVRFPSILFGFLFSLIYYIFIFRLSGNKILSLVFLLLLSVNPWLWHYQRIGFEVSGMLFCLISGIYLFFQSLNQRSYPLLVISAIAFLSSAYFYSTAKLFLVLLVPIFLFLYGRQLLTLFKFQKILLLVAISTLFFLPMIIDTLNGSSGYRFSYINIFTDPTVSPQVDYFRRLNSLTHSGQLLNLSPSLISKIFYNKPALIAQRFISNYLGSFSTSFLFLTSDTNLRHGFSSHGYFYYPDLLLILLGLYQCFSSLQLRSRHIFYKTNLFFLYWLLISPIPFSLTRDSVDPHGTRLIFFTIPLFYFISLSLISLFRLFRTHLSSAIFLSLSIYLLFIVRFFNYYFFIYPQTSALSWHTGIKQTIRLSLSQPFIHYYYIGGQESFLPFFLYYTRYLPPDTCQIAQTIPWANSSFFTGMSVANKYYFGHLEWSKLLPSNLPSASLFIVPESEYTEATKKLPDNLKPHLILNPPTTYETETKYYLFTL